MNTYFTADLHLGHVNMTREGKNLCDRPFDTVEEMNEALIDGINSTVGKDERLVILGDICMGRLDDSLADLSRIEAAEIVLLPGNHDRWSLAYNHREGAGDDARKSWAEKYAAVLEGRGVVFTDSRPSAWRGIFTITGEWSGPTELDRAWFSHYPYEGDSHGEADRYVSLRPGRDGVAPVIHGHVHNTWRERGRQYNVGVDVRDYKPVSEDEIAEWVRSLG